MASSIPHALGIHTTTPQLGLCLSHPERGVTAQLWELGRGMSTQLHEHLFSCISSDELRQLKFIAVAVGPGGFTSTRLGVVTARTLAQQLNIPLFGISSLAAYVWHTLKEGEESGLNCMGDRASIMGESPHGDGLPETLTAVHMPARRGQVFGAVYGIHWGDGRAAEVPSRSLTESPQWTPQSLVSHHDDHVIDQNEWNLFLQSAYPEPMTSVEITGNLGHTVSSVLELALLSSLQNASPHWSTVQPFYGQSPV